MFFNMSELGAALKNTAYHTDSQGYWEELTCRSTTIELATAKITAIAHISMTFNW